MLAKSMAEQGKQLPLARKEQKPSLQQHKENKCI